VQRRYWVAAGIAILSVLVIISSLLIVSALPFGPLGGPSLASENSTATSTATTLPTATILPSPTHTPIIKKPESIVNAPPPPPIPTAPPVTPTVTFCPTPTPLPIPTVTATPLPPTATAVASPSGTSASAAIVGDCQECPYYTGHNPSQSQISSAILAAADLYHLPQNLLLAVAWQESKWHEDVTSCDGGIGLMQVQYYTYPWLNGQSVPECGLSATSYDPNTLQGNADLGAKFLAWLSCFYSYWGNNGGSSLSNPGTYTIAWYYQQAHLQYPDTLNAGGSPNSGSLCAAVFNDPANPEYQTLPSTTSDPWSCPYSATAADATLLDFTLSAYNEGPGYTDENGIQNWSYVDSVEAFIPEFAAGSLPA
jgi:hypothetical protein